jgi:hypothetical protein
MRFPLCASATRAPLVPFAPVKPYSLRSFSTWRSAMLGNRKIYFLDGGVVVASSRAAGASSVRAIQLFGSCLTFS